MRADSIKIESEDDGFHLIIDGDDPTGEYQFARYDFNIHAVAPELFEQVKRQIGSWLAEGEAARGTGVHITEEDLDGYSADDPKRVELLRILDGGGWA